ncbi:hypothetical protein [uncultured Microbacterium sp.]|uniref:hypothetical protein n=1 Tax=uncultured Microbacterium sp. TaxID=191216 RepID=UPI0025D16A17|nr:hypothetical protein [uncultured Microbacterium sp.]
MSAWAASLAKGDEVRVVKPSTREDGVQAWFWDAGEEGQVRRVYSNGDVEVRTFNRAGYRARFSPDEVEAVRPLGNPPPGSLDPHDARLAWVWEDAARLADRNGWCKEFDALCDALGVPGRVRKFSITMHDAGGVRVTARVEARSRRLAEEKLRSAAGGSTKLAVES